MEIDPEAEMLAKKGKVKVNKNVTTHFMTLEPIGCDANHYVFRFKDHLVGEYNDINFKY
jgi:hypothetical protein